MKKNNSISHIIFEAAAVKKLKRAGFQILGNGEETLGEHAFTTSVIAYFLAKQLKADLQKVLTMSIFHDFHEARTGDVHKLQSLYVKRNQKKANEDIFGGIDDNVLKLLNEYEEKKSLESKIVYEANILALLVALKPLAERGDPHASKWLAWNSKRLRLPAAKDIAREIINGNSQDWWMREREILHHAYKE